MGKILISNSANMSSDDIKFLSRRIDKGRGSSLTKDKHTLQ